MTQEELLNRHREELNEVWKIKYPQSQFVAQEFHGWALHLNLSRRTSHASPCNGIHFWFCQSEENQRPSYRYPNGLSEHRFQNSSFGKVRIFDSCEKLIKYARKNNFPEQLISAFQIRYGQQTGV